ncbi:MAG: glycosyltransferase family 9 protein [Culturomica sp.]|jgi:ADP-heptose:LPS heptosyltransferase|nr:glycosyltransferase family 9 protein [Culturomica sp.]
MKRLLVIRLSALGDVAMTVPVLAAVASGRPDLEITVLSRPAFRPLFAQLPSNVVFMPADLKGEHKGAGGLLRLCFTLRKAGFDAVADLHDVLRTKVIRWFLRLCGVRYARIRKGRKEKRELTRQKKKILVRLPSSFERYQQVFNQLNIPAEPDFRSIFGQERGDLSKILHLTGEKGTDKWIGIAPFAKHPGKIYPPQQMEQVIKQLLSTPGLRIFLFGGGPEESDLLASWELKYPGITALPGKLGFANELVLMSWLDGMISMDSANMHLASLTGTPVVSIWGATHPYAGFMGWNQSPENVLQTDLPCRPCSVFGEIPCLRKDYACLWLVSPESIVAKTRIILK